MAIITSAQFTGGLKTLASQGSKTRALIQELLITAVYYAERDGDVGSINRVITAVQDLKSIDMWKIHKWLKTHEAPCKPSADGKSYVFDKAKRHLAQGDTREAFLPYETAMRSGLAWYDLAKAEVNANDVWNAESGFDNFVKKLMKQGYSDAATAVQETYAKLKKQGKLIKLADVAAAQVGEATV